MDPVAGAPRMAEVADAVAMDQHRHLQAREIIRRHAGYRRRLRWHIGERPALHRRAELLRVLLQQNLAIARIATQLLGPDGQLNAEERRVGTERVSTCRYRWTPDQ